MREITRREVVRILGLELPLVLVSTQALPRKVFGEPVIRKTFRMDREALLDLMNNPEVVFRCSQVLDDAYNVIGAKIESVPTAVLGETDPLEMELTNAIVYSINGNKIDATSSQSMDADLARMKDLVEDNVPLAIEMQIRGRIVEYVIQYR